MTVTVKFHDMQAMIAEDMNEGEFPEPHTTTIGPNTVRLINLLNLNAGLDKIRFVWMNANVDRSVGNIESMTLEF